MKSFKSFFLTVLFILSIALSAQAASGDLKFAVISDAHVNGLDSALAFISAQQVDFIIVAGDYYYDQQDYYPHFVKFGFEVNPQLNGDDQPVYFVMGNHDFRPAGEPGFQTLIAPCYPVNGPSNAPKGTVFSFDRGDCHFVITNQYWGYTGGGYSEEQLDWIAQDLSNTSMPFKFVVGHEPAFPLERHVGDSLDADPAMRDRFWTILSDNNVQAFFCGHTHHMSHLVNQNVYQFDAGEIDSGHVCVTIVRVNNGEMVVNSYENPGEDTLVETTAQGENIADIFHRTIIGQSDTTSSPETVLFQGSSPNGSGTCFIDMLK